MIRIDSRVARIAIGGLAVVAALAITASFRDRMKSPQRLAGPVTDVEGSAAATADRLPLAPAPTSAPTSDAAPPAQRAAAGVAVASQESDWVPIRTAVASQQTSRDQQLLSPLHDGWDTEALSDAALRALARLGQALSATDEERKSIIATLCAPVCEGHTLRPTTLHEVFADAMITVRRCEATPPTNSSRWGGATELAASVRALSATMTGDPGEPIVHHFKVIRVVPQDVAVETEVLVEFSAKDGPVSRQVTSTWHCRWQRADAELRLTGIDVLDYEETEVRVANGRWFTDESSTVFTSSADYLDQFAQGHHEWLQRIERVQRFDTSVRNGLAIGDANGDGLDDVYICQPPGLPNRLFLHQADGTVSDVSIASGTHWLDQSSAALFCDLDNDDDQDLVVATPSGLLLMENVGNARYELKETLEVEYDVQSLSAVDYDADGRLDLFICVYRSQKLRSDDSFLYRDASGGGKNRLYRSEVQAGQWRFTDVTSRVGLDDGADRYSLAASWEDFDNDGDQDLYVANDFGRNYLYVNDKGHFVDIAASAGVEDIGSGMSVSWGDFNRDGLPDLYVGNMFSSAGQRVTSQSIFRSAESPEIRAIYQRLAKGNSLFQNRGNGTFSEVGAEAHVELGRWAWSSLFLDLNNDGWEDLLVANGYMTTEDTGDL